MEFIDLKKQYERIKPRIHDRINEVLRHGKFILEAHPQPSDAPVPRSV